MHSVAGSPAAARVFDPGCAPQPCWCRRLERSKIAAVALLLLDVLEPACYLECQIKQPYSR